MVFTKLKTGLAARKIKSSKGNALAKEKPSRRLIGVVLDAEDAEVIHSFRSLGKELQVQPDQLCFLICSETQKEKEYVRFSMSDLSWTGRIQKREVAEFLQQDFELLIVFTKTESSAAVFIVRNSKAGLKIGRTMNTEAQVDLTISCDYEEVTVFIEELKKYIKLIKR